MRRSRGLMTEGMYVKRTICRSFFLIGIALMVLFVCFLIAENAHAYTVQPGDTLYLIGKRTGKDWKELAKINDLKITYKDNIPYVLILIGQEILLEPVKKVWTDAEVKEYMEDTREWLELEIFKIGRIHSPPPRLPIGTGAMVSYEHPTNSVKTMQMIQSMELWISMLKYQLRYFMADEIYIEALAHVNDFKFFDSENYWENHRMICIMLLAIMERESNGYFSRGKAGEEGPYQILPETYCRYRGWDLNKQSIAISRDILQTSSSEGLRCAMDRLSKKDTLRGALSYYNGFGVEADKYAERVLHTYIKKHKHAGRL